MIRWLFAILLIVAALASLLMLGERSGRDAVMETPAPSGPDYWMENSFIERFNEDGQRLLAMNSERLAHYPDQERTELEQVRAEQTGEDELRWLMFADHGLIADDREQVNLWGDVRMERRPGTGLVTYLYSASLDFFPDRELARTDDPVRMERGASVTTGIGFVAAMAEDRMSIMNEVRTRYVSQQD
jgi:lipopolysaccharide export system protein LptC